MEKFYDKGLCFECNKCSNCCRHSGYVFLSENDIKQIATALNMTQDAFTRKFCKSVIGSGEVRISFIEQTSGDCVFYSQEIKGCGIYNSRPLQCKLYPFWEHLVTNVSEWNEEKKTCPGLDCGKRYSKKEIEEHLIKRRLDPIIK